MEKQDSVRLFRYWQLIYMISVLPGKTDQDYADLTGLGKENVYRIARLYNKEGKKFTDELKWGGRRNKRSFLSPGEEENLMKILAEYAKTKKIHTYTDIQQKIEKILGHPVSNDYIWDLLKRHLWRKKKRGSKPKSGFSSYFRINRGQSVWEKS